MNRFHSLLACAAILVQLFATGCATTPPELTEFEPLVRPVAPPAPVYNNGSLFQQRTLSVFEDPRPYKVGDIITIMLDESTSASKTADTSTSKDDTVSIASPTIFGRPLTIGSDDEIGNNEYAPSREFDGQADSSQSNSLSGEISVTVVDILPNGNLVVKGEKWFTLNQGKEYIRVAGVIRPQDVLSDNTIASTKLADAQIAYSGEGFLHDSNTQGWFSQMLNSKWWPF